MTTKGSKCFSHTHARAHARTHAHTVQLPVLSAVQDCEFRVYLREKSALTTQSFKIRSELIRRYKDANPLPTML